MDMNDDIMNMPRGWIVVYENGKIITEYDKDGIETNWKQIPKKGIKSLTLKWHDRHWSITGKDCYIQFKRGWIQPGMDQPFTEERCIGYWEGNNKVIYRVDEQTGKMKMSVESISND